MYGHADDVLDFSRFDGSRYKNIKKTFDINKLPKKPVVVDMKTINDFRFKKLSRNGPGLAYRIQLCD